MACVFESVVSVRLSIHFKFIGFRLVKGYIGSVET